MEPVFSLERFQLNNRNANFNLDTDVHVNVYTFNRSIDDNVKTILDVDVEIGDDNHLYFERALCISKRPERNVRIRNDSKYINIKDIRTEIRKQSKDILFKINGNSDVYKRYKGGNPLAKIGPQFEWLNYKLGINMKNVNLNPESITESMTIGGYAMLSIDDHIDQNVHSLVGFKFVEKIRYILIELNRAPFNGEQVEWKIPLIYALYCVVSRGFSDTIYLLGIWNSVYGQLRYKTFGRDFPRGMGVQMIKYSSTYIYENVKTFTYIGMDALYNSRKILLSREPRITLYRYPVVGVILVKYNPNTKKRGYTKLKWPDIDYDEIENEPGRVENYNSVIHPDKNIVPESLDIDIAAELQDYHYILYNDLQEYNYMPTIRNCVVCNEIATHVCGVCKTMTYCSEGCQKIDWINTHYLQCGK